MLQVVLLPVGSIVAWLGHQKVYLQLSLFTLFTLYLCSLETAQSQKDGKSVMAL